jgi:small-conductance mechanosensitive channel
MNFLTLFSSEFSHNIGLLFGTLVLGVLLYILAFYFVKYWAKTKTSFVPALLQKHIYYPGLFVMVILTLIIGLPFIRKHLEVEWYNSVYHLLTIMLIVSFGLLVSSSIALTRSLIEHHYEGQTGIGYKYRKAKTQYLMLQRIMNVIIIVIALGTVLMTFDSVRKIGGAILASAGVLGLVLGFAAQKSIGTIFAGIQIAVSQPIRLDDIVVVEGQNGVISEITLTYAVVNTGDGRKLIVPISYFIDKSFENWTRSSPEMIGKIKLHTDYTLPVGAVRTELMNILAGTELWDKRSANLLVTGSNPQTMELTATMSARSPADSGVLECYVREKMIGFIQQNYPGSLPQTRVTKNDSVKQV